MSGPVNPRWRLWLPLLLGAAALALFGDKTPSDAIVAAGAGPQAVRSAPTATPWAGPAPTLVSHATTEASTVHDVLPLDRARLFPPAPDRKPARDLFAAVSWLPAPPPAGPAASPRADAPPPLPTLTVLGKKYEATAWEVYLALGDQTLVAREGTVFDGGLRVDSIAPPILKLTLPSTGQTLSLDIGEAR